MPGPKPTRGGTCTPRSDAREWTRWRTTIPSRRPPRTATSALKASRSASRHARGRRPQPRRIERGSFFAMLGPWAAANHDAADDRRVRGSDGGARVPRRRRRDRSPAVPARRQHGLPELRALSAPDRRAHVAFGLERKKVGKEEVRRRVGEILELVQLTGLGKRRPSQLSGGQQQQRVRARPRAVNHPRALLLDERWARSTCASVVSCRSSSSASSRMSASRSCT